MNLRSQKDKEKRILAKLIPMPLRMEIYSDIPGICFQDVSWFFSACIVYYMISDLGQVMECDSMCVFSSTLVFEKRFCQFPVCQLAYFNVYV